MKTLYYLSVFCLLFCVNEAHSYFLSHSTNLVAQIKPNPNTGSEPTSSFTKLTGIYFINKDSQITFSKKDCPSGYTWYEGSCKEDCDENKFPYSDKPDSKKGVVVCTVCLGKVQCGYSECTEGWRLLNGKCDTCYEGYNLVNNTCVRVCNYPLTSLPANCLSAKSCKLGSSGGTTTYYDKNCTTCKEGYQLNNGTCSPNPCTGYNSPTQTITGCKSSAVCQKGDNKVYKCDVCYTGYDLNNGSCIKNCNYPLTALPANCQDAAQCRLGNAGGETTYYSDTCSTCKNGYTLTAGKCVPNSCTGYDSTIPAIAGCKNSTVCQKGEDKFYKCEICYTGYTLSNGVCKKNCTYTATILPANCTTAQSCKLGSASGETIYYSDTCVTCKDGYTLSGGKCIPSTCIGYNSQVSTIDGCKTTDTCKKGDTSVYTCSQCYTGYELIDGVCTKNCTYTATTLPANCLSAPNCKLGSASGETTYYSDTCTTCKNGYTLSGGKCVPNACTGYNSSTSVISGCKTAESCQKGENKVYKCALCYTGYSLNNGVCTKNCSYTSTTLPANCLSAPNCKLGSASGETTYYSDTCTTCKNGYTLNGGVCVPNACTGYNSSTSVISGCKTAESCQKGENKVYKCALCYTGYTLNNGVCTKNCTYTSTTLPANCLSAPNCKLGSASGETTYYSNTCTTCKNGYTLSGGKCVPNACTGYNSSTSVISGCKTTESCQKGNSKVYKCTLCYTGYDLNNGVCNKICSYTSTTLPDNCKEADSCELGSASGITTYYDTTCKVCNEGYRFDDYTKACKVIEYIPGVYYQDDTPIGVIFYEDATVTKIIGMYDITFEGKVEHGGNMCSWINRPEVDGLNTYDYGEENELVKDMNGKRNTQKILAADDTNGIHTPVVIAAVNKYAPSVCEAGSFCGKGEWYLPSMGELRIIYNNLSTIQSKLSRAEGGELDVSNNRVSSYWSSSLATDFHYAWGIKFYNGEATYHNISDSEHTRPALEIYKH